MKYLLFQRNAMHSQVKTTLLKLLFICFAFNLAAQDSHPFLDFFHQNVEKSISNRRFAYTSIKPVIDRLRADDQFKVEKLGESVEGLPINMVCWGDGEEVLLLWSQMHLIQLQPEPFSLARDYSWL